MRANQDSKTIASDGDAERSSYGIGERVSGEDIERIVELANFKSIRVGQRVYDVEAAIKRSHRRRERGKVIRGLTVDLLVCNIDAYYVRCSLHRTATVISQFRNRPNFAAFVVNGAIKALVLDQDAIATNNGGSEGGPLIGGSHP